jgi:hypothetical protein
MRLGRLLGNQKSDEDFLSVQRGNFVRCTLDISLAKRARRLSKCLSLVAAARWLDLWRC